MEKKKFKIDWTNVMKKIKEQNNEQNSRNFNDDKRIFMPQYKEDGTFQSIIRFLPSKDTDIPFIDVYSHGFKGIGGSWFVENCPTTIKKKCPVCEANKLLWDDSPNVVRNRKRKLSYYANILVIKDPQTPENNGKIFLFRYGKKIQDKIMEKWQPEEGGILKPVHIFDYYEGANFNLIIKKIKVDGKLIPNYDASQFDVVSSVGSDEEIERIHNSLFSLKDFHAESNFKSFEELKERFERVVGQTINTKNLEKKENNNIERIAKTVLNENENNERMIDENDIFSGSDQSFFESLQSE